VIAEFIKGSPIATEADRLFALAELRYAYASENGPQEYFFASATYAYDLPRKTIQVLSYNKDRNRHWESARYRRKDLSWIRHY
jgi:hypothetical protein